MTKVLYLIGSGILGGHGVMVGNGWEVAVAVCFMLGTMLAFTEYER